MRRHFALFMSSLAGGGVQRSMLNLAEAFVARGHRVDLVVCKAEGSCRKEVPAGVNLMALRPASRAWARLCVLVADPTGLKPLLRPVLLPLKASAKLRYLPGLARYLRHEQPDVLLSAMTNPNLVAVWARRLAGVRTRVVLSEHNTLSRFVHHFKNRWRWRLLPPVVRRTYPGADAIIAVSVAVAADLSVSAGIPRERIIVIYNPVVSPALERKARAPLDHPAFHQLAPPVVLGAGRLETAKDFPTLLKAFAQVRAAREARLVILGDGRRRAALERLARELGIAAEVHFPGWVANPLAYMARAAVFVLSSAWEGLGCVLIEAMACGCPVVSTDCPSGPAEILGGGTHGSLVPVGDVPALAAAITAALDKPPDRARLRERAAQFSVDRAAERYLEVLLGSPRCGAMHARQHWPAGSANRVDD